MDSDRVNTYTTMPTQSQAPPSIQSYTSTYLSPEVPSQQEDRMHPSILNAFKQNPYTKSLSSY